MNRKEIKDFLETLHFHGYIDHDITKLDNLIDDYYPEQLPQADVIKSVCIECDNEGGTHGVNGWQKCSKGCK